MGHKRSSGGHGSGIVSTPRAELKPAAADLVEQRKDCSTRVDELSAKGHSPAA